MLVFVIRSRGMNMLRLQIFSALIAISAIFFGCGDDAYCPEGHSWCWAKCYNLMTDEDNCGQCGNKCEPHSDCIDGICACNPGYAICDGQCVNLNFDVENCGTCGNACAAGGGCVNGTCGGPLPDCYLWGLIDCAGVCFDPMTDENHCGGCYNKCRADQTCRDGSCECFGSLQDCDNECVDTQHDSDHCGQCYSPCEAGERCSEGSCIVVSCPIGEWPCGRECADLQTSNEHCGACYNACNTSGGLFCLNGDCECITGTECVAGVCTDTGTDEQNCGACGNTCRADQVCDESQCRCAAGMTECEDPPVCVDLQLDPNHCGVCDNRCPSGWFCAAGSCGAGCWPPRVLCGLDCVDLNFSNSHCGQCDNPCDLDNGYVCQSGVCDCVPGYSDCGGVCVDLNSDEQNCGSCGNECSSNGTCMGGTCGEPDSRIELTCPESYMPPDASMQCVVMVHRLGGSPPPIDVTDHATFTVTECGTPDCVSDQDVIASVVGGLVTTVGYGIGVQGDRATISANYSGIDTNQWTITLVRDFLCDVKIVPKGFSVEDWGKHQDFALPYLANAAGGVNWEFIPVGIYRNDAQCSMGGPYLRELTDGGNWSVTPGGYLSFTDVGSNRAEAEVVYQAAYPAADQTVTIEYSRSIQPPDREVTDSLYLDIVALTDTNWTLQATPAALIIPNGLQDGVRMMMSFGGNELDVTGFGFGSRSWMVAPTVTDTSDPDVVTMDGYHSSGTLGGRYVFNASEGPGSTVVEWEMEDTQETPHSESVSIPIDVIDAVPVECVIYLEVPPPGPDEPATPEIYPTRHPDVQYKAYACMSDIGAGCAFADMRDITDENWGGGWQMVYQGTEGTLGSVDAFGSATPGLYRIPMFAPANPNPENGYIRYQYGPDAADGCAVEVRIRERYLCAVDLSFDRRPWYPRAAGAADDEVLLPNVDGVTQLFSVYAEWGFMQGLNCADDGNGLVNGYRTKLSVGDIYEWEYEDNGQHTEPIFGTGGIDLATGIGTVIASTTEPNRFADITIHVHLAPHDCDPVHGCTDTIRVNACGIRVTPDLRLASAFDEVNGFEEQPLQVSVGDTTKVYGISRYEAPPGGCSFVAGADAEYWLDESRQANVEFQSQSLSIALTDNDGFVYAKAEGQTALSVNWNGGAAEDNLPIEVLPAD